MIELDRFPFSFEAWSLKVRDHLVEFRRPLVMAILNVTPDSFFDGGSYQTEQKIFQHLESLLNSGADIIDIGAHSTRPGALHITEKEEWSRLEPALNMALALKDKFKFLISIDTFRAGIADSALKKGGDMVNDISAGRFDPELWDVVSHYQSPYILMHMNVSLELERFDYITDYRDMLTDISRFFREKLDLLEQKNIHDVILDVGFGFGKNVAQNYELVRNLEMFHSMGLPILCGVSRKSMIQKLFQISPQQALNATTALHMMLLLKGTKILRVHDVLEAKQAISIFEKSI